MGFANGYATGFATVDWSMPMASGKPRRGSDKSGRVPGGREGGSIGRLGLAGLGWALPGSPAGCLPGRLGWLLGWLCLSVRPVPVSPLFPPLLNNLVLLVGGLGSLGPWFPPWAVVGRLPSPPLFCSEGLVA